jgi:16S rRNA (cytosine1402-N4)-methyltransferase
MPDPTDETTDGGFHHRPVLLDEVRTLLRPVPAGWLVDLTLGGAGHAAALLEDRPDLRLLGIDRDPSALEAAAARLAPMADRVVLRHARSDRLAELLTEVGAEPVTAVLADLGVSSPQLDRPERGFSYSRSGPLDMRQDPTQSRTAADIVNGWDEARLARLLRDEGDERFARRIAAAIVASRPLGTTTELADAVRDAIPAPARRRGGHPAKRTFQAIRIAVNDELTVLADTLDQALVALAPGGRAVVMSYQSNEDRIVKARFRAAADGGCTCPPGLPCVCGAVPTVRLLKRGSITPGAEELAGNRRAESARLRAVEKLTTGSPR